MSEFEQKVLALLQGIDSKLDKLISSQISKLRAKSGTPEQTTTTTHVAVTPTPATTKPSEVVDKQDMDDKAVEKPPVEGRRVCTKCAGTTFNAVEDKMQVLHQMGGVKIYAKKYVCKGCGEIN